jgi:hypothetical protein
MRVVAQNEVHVGERQTQDLDGEHALGVRCAEGLHGLGGVVEVVG